MESSKLQLIFKNNEDKKITISVDEPKDDLTKLEVKTAMEVLVAKNIFDYDGGGMVVAIGARRVTTTVEKFEI